MRAPDDVDKFLSEEKAFEDKRQVLIEDLLKQKEVAMKDFDMKLAKLGYHADGAKHKRSHHKKGAAAPAAEPKAKG
jgi:hypothetical protein